MDQGHENFSLLSDPLKCQVVVAMTKSICTVQVEVRADDMGQGEGVQVLTCDSRRWHDEDAEEIRLVPKVLNRIVSVQVQVLVSTCTLTTSPPVFAFPPPWQILSYLTLAKQFLSSTFFQHPLFTLFTLHHRPVQKPISHRDGEKKVIRSSQSSVSELRHSFPPLGTLAPSPSARYLIRPLGREEEMFLRRTASCCLQKPTPLTVLRASTSDGSGPWSCID
ncbi:hypothetical protein J3F83DRAFT_756574 [Trichoderma novae-zelandiae]